MILKLRYIRNNTTYNCLYCPSCYATSWDVIRYVESADIELVCNECSRAFTMAELIHVIKGDAVIEV